MKRPQCGPKGGLDNAAYFIRVEWLGQYIVATQVQHFRPKMFVGELGCDNHAWRRGANGCKSEKLAPVSIGYNDADVEFIEKRRGFSVISGLVNGPPTGCEHRRERSTGILAR